MNYENKDFLLSKTTLDHIELSKLNSYNYDSFVAKIYNFINNFDGISNDSLEYGNWEEKKLALDDSETSFLKKILKKRKSIRNFTNKKLSYEELSAFLNTSYDVFDKKNRSIPAAGGIYCVDVFFINLSVSNLEKGIFLYDPLKKAILKKPNDLLNTDDFETKIKKAFPIDKDKTIDFKNASGILVFTGNLNKLAIKYGERSFRMSLLETGALMQNFYLSSVENNIGICSYYGYLDDKLNQMLGLVSPYETSLLTIIIGK